MILFFSGSGANYHRPEQALADYNPAVMLTYFEIRERNSMTIKRFERHLERRRKQNEGPSKKRKGRDNKVGVQRKRKKG